MVYYYGVQGPQRPDAVHPDKPSHHFRPGHGVQRLLRRRFFQTRAVVLLFSAAACLCGRRICSHARPDEPRLPLLAAGQGSGVAADPERRKSPPGFHTTAYQRGPPLVTLWVLHILSALRNRQTGVLGLHGLLPP